MLSVQLKIRAPGAKTFLQVINARFGSTTHKVYCAFALATNIIVTAMLMLGGAAVTTSLVKFMSVEYATTLVAAIIGGYTFIGGLGAIFYVSYFNSAIIYIVLVVFISKVYMDSGDDSNPIGGIERVYELLACAEGPEGNLDYSFLTILSDAGLKFGIINIVGNFGTVFVDQSYWQSSVAAKPRQGVLGFLFGGLAWFGIPFSMATAMGLGYIALSSKQGEPLLTDKEIDLGLVPPAVASRLLGKSGQLMMLCMILMAVTSTASAEIIAVTSILVYDVYGTYLRPFRRTTDTNSCILCGKGRGRLANPRDKCVCVSMTHCLKCAMDDKNLSLDKRTSFRREYKCPTHGHFREYTEYLGHLRNWCLVWTTLSILPLTVILYMMQLSLGWVYLFMGILVGSAVVPITLTMFWARLTGAAMIAGSVGGTVLALVVWLAVASTFDRGLGNFLINTGQEMSMLCGNLVAIFAGGIITVVTSLLTNRGYVKEQEAEVWENTRDIDNPLSPWTEVYAKELELTGAHQLDNRPSLEEVRSTFRVARLLANVGSISLTVVLVILWPAGMIYNQVLSLNEFTAWVVLSRTWAILALVFLLVAPLVNEAYDLYTAFKGGHKIDCEVESQMPGEDPGGGSQQRPHGKVSTQETRAHPTKVFKPVLALRDASSPSKCTISSSQRLNGSTVGKQEEKAGGISVLEHNRTVGPGTKEEASITLERNGGLFITTDSAEDEVEVASDNDDFRQPVF